MLMEYKKVGEMGNGIKLNFVIPELIEKALEEYCDQTGRSASDLVRQLLSEFIDNDRKLSIPTKDTPDGVRSNMILPSRLLDALDEKIAMEGHTTRGSVISRLLQDFLENKVGEHFGEKVEITLDRNLYNKFVEKNKTSGKEIEDLILEACDKFIKESK